MLIILNAITAFSKTLDAFKAQDFLVVAKLSRGQAVVPLSIFAFLARQAESLFSGVGIPKLRRPTPQISRIATVNGFANVSENAPKLT